MSPDQEATDCPNGHGRMNRLRKMKTVTLACNVWDYAADVHVCPVCGLEAETDNKAADGGAGKS